MGHEIGVPKAIERGQRGPDQPLLAVEEARSRGLGLFSKQFRKSNSRKYAVAISLSSGRALGTWTGAMRCFCKPWFTRWSHSWREHASFGRKVWQANFGRISNRLEVSAG